MLNAVLKINLLLGLGTVAGVKLCYFARLFKSDIIIKCKNGQASAKSLLGLLSLCLMYNTVVEVCVNGEDEENAMENIKWILTYKNIDNLEFCNKLSLNDLKNIKNRFVDSIDRDCSDYNDPEFQSWICDRSFLIVRSWFNEKSSYLYPDQDSRIVNRCEKFGIIWKSIYPADAEIKDKSEAMRMSKKVIIKYIKSINPTTILFHRGMLAIYLDSLFMKMVDLIKKHFPEKEIIIGPPKHTETEGHIISNVALPFDDEILINFFNL